MAVPVLALGPLLAFLGSASARIFAEKLLVWLAFKVFLTGLFVVIVPIILNNFMYDTLEIAKNFMEGKLSTVTNPDGNMSFTGFLAWLVECFRIPECIAVIVSALQLRLVLSMIPFIGR